MRFLPVALTILAVPLMATLVVSGGHALKGGQGVVTVDRIDPGADTMPQAGSDAVPEEPATSAIPAPAASQPLKAVVHSRAIDPDIVAPPGPPDEELERVEPRAPLGDLALAGPPKPRKSKMPDGQDGSKLFQPVASAAGVIEAKDYSVTVSGIDIVKDDETCSDEGKSWACGVRARTAFRAFLRGRTIVCSVPSQGGHDAASTKCWVGNKDVGEWLVENGWARAAQGGPYVEAGDKARAARKGIFGAAPDLDGLPELPAAAGPAPVAPESILPTDDGAVTPPADQPAPAQ